jgi:hypothetical protein
MIAILNGNKELCPSIQWVRELNIALDGLNLLNGPTQHNLVRQLLVGQATTTSRMAVRHLHDKGHDRLKEAARAAHLVARYLRRHCCKPKDTMTHVFVNHLARINYQEMCYLPPAFSVT